MNAPTPDEKQLTGLLMLGLGVGFSAVAGYLAARNQKRLRESISTEGTVVDTVKVMGQEGSHSYRVVIEFADESGIKHRYTSRAAASGWGNAKGKRMRILYRRCDPADARVQAFWVQWMMVLMLAGPALICFVVGAVVLLFPEL